MPCLFSRYNDFVLYCTFFLQRPAKKIFINIVGFKKLKIPTQVDRFESAHRKRCCAAAGPLRSMYCAYIVILIYTAYLQLYIALYIPTACSVYCTYTSTQHVDNTIGALSFIIIIIYSCYSQHNIRALSYTASSKCNKYRASIVRPEELDQVTLLNLSRRPVTDPHADPLLYYRLRLLRTRRA